MYYKMATHKIDLFRGGKDGRVIPHYPRTNMQMATHTVNELQFFFRDWLPASQVPQEYLQYSGSLSDALICDSANITNNQNTARRMFVLVFMAG